jgi:methionine synthase II (cobalamin-independent)
MTRNIQLPRADQVGSQLRPQALLDARASHARRQIDDAALRLVVELANEVWADARAV